MVGWRILAGWELLRRRRSCRVRVRCLRFCLCVGYLLFSLFSFFLERGGLRDGYSAVWVIRIDMYLCISTYFEFLLHSHFGR